MNADPGPGPTVLFNKLEGNLLSPELRFLCYHSPTFLSTFAYLKSRLFSLIFFLIGVQISGRVGRRIHLILQVEQPALELILITARDLAVKYPSSCRQCCGSRSKVRSELRTFVDPDPYSEYRIN